MNERKYDLIYSVIVKDFFGDLYSSNYYTNEHATKFFWVECLTIAKQINELKKFYIVNNVDGASDYMKNEYNTLIEIHENIIYEGVSSGYDMAFDDWDKYKALV